jgi:hypothetical protein
VTPGDVFAVDVAFCAGAVAVSAGTVDAVGAGSLIEGRELPAGAGSVLVDGEAWREILGLDAADAATLFDA